MNPTCPFCKSEMTKNFKHQYDKSDYYYTYSCCRDESTGGLYRFTLGTTAGGDFQYARCILGEFPNMYDAVCEYAINTCDIERYCPERQHWVGVVILDAIPKFDWSDLESIKQKLQLYIALA